MLTTMRRHGIRLALFAILATALTAIVHQLTTRTIAHQAALQQQRLFDQVIAPDGYDNDLQRSCLLLRDPRLATARRTGCIWPSVRASQSRRWSRPPHPMAMPVPFVCWSAPISAVRFWAYGYKSSTKPRGWVIKLKSVSPTGSTAFAIRSCTVHRIRRSG